MNINNLQNKYISFLTESKHIFFLVLIVIAEFLFYIFQININYFLSDAYYYSSIAESIASGIGLFDSTRYPITSISTYQTGIVFVHLILLKLGMVNQELRLLAVEFINFLSLLGSLIFIYKIFLSFNIKKNIILLFLYTFILLPNIVLNFLNPINDGIFYLLTFLAVFLILKEHKSKFDFISLSLLSIIIVQFRFQGVILFLAALLAALISGKYRHFFIYSFIFILSYSSFYIFSTIVIKDQSLIIFYKQYILNNYSIDFFLANIVKTFTDILPSLFMSTASLSGIIYIIFIFIILMLMFVSYKAFRNKNFILLFITLFIFGNLSFVQFFVDIEVRYVLIIMPFTLLLLLILLKNNNYKFIVMTSYFTFAVIVMIIKLFIFSDNYEINRENKKITQNVLHEMAISNEQYDVITDSLNCRLAFFLFEKSIITDVVYLKKKYVIVFGNEDFTKDVLNKIISINKKYNHIDTIGGWIAVKRNINSLEYLKYKIGYMNQSADKIKRSKDSSFNSTIIKIE